MESDEDPILVKFLISSLEFEKLKYYEAKYHEISKEVESLKSQKIQLGQGNFVVDQNSLDQITTPALKEVESKDKPLINYSVPIKKNDDNDDFDESALLHLISKKQKFAAKVLLDKIDDRGSELTWNSSGTIYIDKTSIPNSNIFTVYPYLFQNTWPKRDIPGLKEVVAKLEDIGLSSLITLKNQHTFVNNITATAANFGPKSVLLETTLKDESTNSSSKEAANHEVSKSEVEQPTAHLSNSWNWWFIE